jgi:hypothetical protein
MVSLRDERQLWRLAVNKMLIAAAFFAIAAAFGSGAQAGFNVRLTAPAGFSTLEKTGCGGGGYFRSFRRRTYSSAHQSVKRKVHVARKPAASSVAVAKAEPEKKVEAVAQVESENSSISTANGKVAEAEPIADVKPVEKKVATAAKEVGCKQFFPSVGMTLSVSCE